MKTYKILSIASTLLLSFLSCSPIEDRDSLENSFDLDKLELLLVKQSGNNGNGITLKMNTKGVYGYWDYNINREYTDEVSFIYPIPGKAKFTYYATTGYINNDVLSDVKYDIKKEIEVNIEELDQQLPGQYYDLVGENLEGKTWVFAGGLGGSKYWYMCPGDNPEKYEEIWWDAGECCPPIDVDGKMTFDLDGGANYLYYESSESEPKKGGSYSFNGDFSKLIITGEYKILGNEEPRGNDKGVYEIISLSSDRLILYSIATRTRIPPSIHIT